MRQQRSVSLTSATTVSGSVMTLEFIALSWALSTLRTACPTLPQYIRWVQFCCAVDMIVGVVLMSRSVSQEVLSPFDPQSRRLRVDKNISLRIYCRDQAPGEQNHNSSGLHGTRVLGCVTTASNNSCWLAVCFQVIV